MIDALGELEHRIREPGGLVLRMGHLYGPGTIYAPNGYFTEHVRARAVPLVGAGRSVFSFTHVEDAATAMLAALDRPAAGVLNIVDDAPTPIADWLPARGVGRRTRRDACQRRSSDSPSADGGLHF